LNSPQRLTGPGRVHGPGASAGARGECTGPGRVHGPGASVGLRRGGTLSSFGSPRTAGEGGWPSSLRLAPARVFAPHACVGLLHLRPASCTCPVVSRPRHCLRRAMTGAGPPRAFVRGSASGGSCAGPPRGFVRGSASGVRARVRLARSCAGPPRAFVRGSASGVSGQILRRRADPFRRRLRRSGGGARLPPAARADWSGRRRRSAAVRWRCRRAGR
jgi:hypothetical protein